MPNTIRLACRLCDCEDYDGVASLPRDWFNVEEFQSYADSIRPENYWHTHLGVCPDCQEMLFSPIDEAAIAE